MDWWTKTSAVVTTWVKLSQFFLRSQQFLAEPLVVCGKVETYCKTRHIQSKAWSPSCDTQTLFNLPLCLCHLPLSQPDIYRQSALCVHVQTFDPCINSPFTHLNNFFLTHFNLSVSGSFKCLLSYQAMILHFNFSILLYCFTEQVFMEQRDLNVSHLIKRDISLCSVHNDVFLFLRWHIGSCKALSTVGIEKKLHFIKHTILYLIWQIIPNSENSKHIDRTYSHPFVILSFSWHNISPKGFAMDIELKCILIYVQIHMSKMLFSYIYIYFIYI